ncbi:hypothetical protein PP707_08310 [Acetobacter pasteurianus]|nr:hypothetical protein [Acetobacter pasteurianus]
MWSDFPTTPLDSPECCNGKHSFSHLHNEVKVNTLMSLLNLMNLMNLLNLMNILNELRPTL